MCDETRDEAGNFNNRKRRFVIAMKHFFQRLIDRSELDAHTFHIKHQWICYVAVYGMHDCQRKGPLRKHASAIYCELEWL